VERDTGRDISLTETLACEQRNRELEPGAAENSGELSCHEEGNVVISGGLSEGLLNSHHFGKSNIKGSEETFLTSKAKKL